MSLYRRLFSIVLSAVLIVSFPGANAAFAEVTEVATISKSADAVTEYSVVDVESADATAEASAVNTEISDAIEFVYLEQSTVELGQTESLAVALSDETAVLKEAKAVFASPNGGQSITYASSSVAGNAAAFTFSFDENSVLGNYTLVSLSFTFADSSPAIFVDMLDGVSESERCSFEVVSAVPATFSAFSSDVVDAGVTAYVITEEGELEEASSISDAIQKADSKGVSDTVVDGSGATVASSSSSDEPQSLVESIVSPAKAYAAQTSARENYLVVALDPGHGGYDGGAGDYGLAEKDVNLSIAQYCYNELSAYSGVTPVLTRSGDYYVGLEERVDYAVSMGADVFISLHCNSSTASSASGAEVYYPNPSSYNHDAYETGQALASRIYDKLAALGLDTGRGIKYRDSEYYNGSGPYYYPDGYYADFYSVIEGSREAGIPGLIVEHAFMSNPDDASNLANDSFRQQLGIADATAVAQQYNVMKKTEAQAQSLVQTRAHIASLGWESEVYDQKVAGSTGKSLGLQAFQISLQNAAAAQGGIRYQAYVGDSWQSWQNDGATAGTVGQSTPLQAVKIELTGNSANVYDVYYRVHVAGFGWLDWAKNGESAGSVGFGYQAEAVEVTLVAKGSAAPGSTAKPFRIPSTSLTAQAHVAQVGWQGAVAEGTVSGTTGQGLSMEALRLSLRYQQESGSIEYSAHVSGIGWQDAVSDGAVAGTTGQSKQMEAVRISLSGDVSQKYDVYYRVHSAEVGWLGWAKNGESAGTAGYSYGMQAIQVVLVEEGGAAPGSTDGAFKEKALAAFQGTSIMGASSTSAAQMARAFNASGNKFPSSTYAQYGAVDINQFCAIVLEEAESEGVKAEVVFAQAMKETGWLKFGGDVKAEQCNFAGLGATGGGVSGNSFNTNGSNSVRIGIRAQVQHLKAYASTESLNNALVDERFKYVTRSCAPYVEWLGKQENPSGEGWAASKNYGTNLVVLMNSILSA